MGRIHGVGTDILELNRVERILAREQSERFLQRILTRSELELFRKNGRASFAGGRFAAKEAVVKALGTGIGKQVGFLDIEILPDPNGRPNCELSVQAKERLRLDNPVIHLSISHSQSYVTAMAVVELLK